MENSMIKMAMEITTMFPAEEQQTKRLEVGESWTALLGGRRKAEQKKSQQNLSFYYWLVLEEIVAAALEIILLCSLMFFFDSWTLPSRANSWDLMFLNGIISLCNLQ